VNNPAFVQVLSTDLTAFQDSGLTTGSCLNEVRDTFEKLYTGDASATTVQTDDTRGEGPIYDAATNLCLDKLDDFRTEATNEIDDKIDSYTNDADKQENKAKETFLRLIESSMVKLHGLTDLTATEKVTLKEAIIAKRTDYASRVMGWSSELSTTLEALKDGAAASDDESTTLINEFSEGGFTIKTMTKRTTFAEEFAHEDVDATLTVNEDSVGEWLEDYYNEKLAELNDHIENESMIGEALSQEIETWLTNHVTDLQEALA